MKLAGEVAVITGGASGIGRGSALAMARAGADIVLADVNEARLAQVAAEVAALGRRVLAVHCDVARDDDVEALASAAEATLGPVSVLMNNAGVVLRGALESIAVADWQWCLGINVFGVIRGIHAFLPRMIERRRGYIVNTGSVAGLVALTGEGAPYVASKFAVVGLTEALALYVRPFGIGVSLLCPGGVRTNLGETGRSIGMTPEREQAETRMARAVQGGAELEPEDVGERVVAAIMAEQFLILPDEIHADLIRRRGQDLNAFLKFRFASVSDPHPPLPREGEGGF
ncbi:MAG TPA: SDR family NAD(P)-dependent oxidoreductase [Chloroflexota bacterium]|nr:SDR family NAD(P)-dependent oxidoreductase [Chloroflexota bacterium]